MTRVEVIQQLINLTSTQYYLEIGVNRGACFLNIKAPHKTAVDPNFIISLFKKLKYLFKNFKNINNHYFEVTSDDFFQEQKQWLQTYSPKVVFIDGLHTYEQSLKDVLNVLEATNDNAMIVMHDCNPLTEAAAYPAKSIFQAQEDKPAGWDGTWNGDVWKTMVYLRSMRKDLNSFVLNTDHGLGIVYKGIPENTLDFSKEAIDKLTYKDLEKNRLELLNLKPVEYFNTFLNLIKN